MTAFRSSVGPANPGLGTSFTITEPAGAATDDILICAVYTDASSETVTPPAGWNSTFNGTAISQSLSITGEIWQLNAFWIRRGASAPSLTFTLSVSNNCVYQVCAYSGALASGDPFSFGTSAKRDTTATAAFPAVSGTTAVANEFVIWVGANFIGGTASAPTGFTGRAIVPDFDLYWADKLQAAAGATGSITQSWTVAGNGTAASILLGLEPSGGAAAAATPQPVVGIQAVHRASRW